MGNPQSILAQPSQVQFLGIAVVAVIRGNRGQEFPGHSSRPTVMASQLGICQLSQLCRKLVVVAMAAAGSNDIGLHRLTQQLQVAHQVEKLVPDKGLQQRRCLREPIGVYYYCVFLCCCPFRRSSAHCGSADRKC